MGHTSRLLLYVSSILLAASAFAADDDPWFRTWSGSCIDPDIGRDSVTGRLAVACGDTLRLLDEQGGVVAETQYLNVFSADPQPLQALAAYPFGGFGVLANSSYASVDGATAPGFGFNLASGVVWDVEPADAGSGTGIVAANSQGRIYAFLPTGAVTLAGSLDVPFVSLFEVTFDGTFPVVATGPVIFSVATETALSTADLGVEEITDIHYDAGEVVFAARGAAASGQFWLGRMSLSGGSYAWVQRIDFGSQYSAEIASLSAAADGGWLLVGTIWEPGADDPDPWLARTDAQGNLIWQRSYPLGAINVFTDAVELPDGSWAVAGDSTELGYGSELIVLRVDASGVGCLADSPTSFPVTQVSSAPTGTTATYTSESLPGTLEFTAGATSTPAIDRCLPGAVPDPYERDEPYPGIRSLMGDTVQARNFADDDLDEAFFWGCPGRTYTVAATPVASGLDLTLSLYGSDGSLLAVQDDAPAGGSEQIALAPDGTPGREGGQYRVTVAAPGAAGPGTDYELQLTGPAGECATWSKTLSSTILPARPLTGTHFPGGALLVAHDDGGGAGGEGISYQLDAEGTIRLSQRLSSPEPGDLVPQGAQIDPLTDAVHLLVGGENGASGYVGRVTLDTTGAPAGVASITSRTPPYNLADMAWSPSGQAAAIFEDATAGGCEWTGVSRTGDGLFDLGFTCPLNVDSDRYRTVDLAPGGFTYWAGIPRSGFGDTFWVGRVGRSNALASEQLYELQGVDQPFVLDVADSAVDAGGGIAVLLEGSDGVDGDSDAWLVRLSSRLTVEQVVRIGETGIHEIPRALVPMPGGGYTVLLQTDGHPQGNGSGDALLVQIDDSGASAWQRFVGDAGMQEADLLLGSPAGGLVLLGRDAGAPWAVQLDPDRTGDAPDACDPVANGSVPVALAAAASLSFSLTGYDFLYFTPGNGFDASPASNSSVNICTSACVDADGDGFDEPSCLTGDDCDDSDATIYPGATEICDGRDNDCDSVVPAPETDDDGDGWVECDPVVAGLLGGDCDDGDPIVFPGFVEFCDGKDTDCDGDLPPEEADGDGDGVILCNPLFGEVEGNDCDDGDPAIYPGAVEICDGRDSDCDFIVPTEESDVDGDGFFACMPVGPTGAGMGGDCDDLEYRVYPGAPESNDRVDNQCPGYYGYGTIDEIGDTLVFDAMGAPDRMSWEAQPGAFQYEVVRGIDPGFTDCSGTTSVVVTFDTSITVTEPPPGVAYYYMVRPTIPLVGSWGLDSAGIERTPPCF